MNFKNVEKKYQLYISIITETLSIQTTFLTNHLWMFLIGRVQIFNGQEV